MKAPALKVLAAAVVIGIAGDGLLRGGPWRLGFALWIAVLVAAVFAIGGRRTRAPLLMMIGVLFAAFGLVWRDAPMLYAVDMLSVLCMGALILWSGSGGDVGQLTLVESVRVGVIALVNTVGGAAAVVGEGLAMQGSNPSRRATIRAVVIGTVLALPPVLLVSSLLARSDQIFDRVLQQIVTTISSAGLSHLLVAALLAWIATGWLKAALGEGTASVVPQVSSPGLRFASVAVGLYALIALLLLFVVTQARVVFGGAAFLRETAGLTVANYAREGFFQLIVAAVIVLCTLAIAEWLLAGDDARGHRHYTIAGAVLLALVATLLVSAAVRIGLYVSEFGLSVDRAFASSGILWVCGLLVAFALTTLRGRAVQFMPVSIAVTIAWVVLVNLVNPEAFVVHVNVSRAVHGHAFDAKYHARLSADALPSLVRGAPRLNAADCLLLESSLRLNWNARFAAQASGGRDWRSVDLPLRRAADWVRAPTLSCAGAPGVPVQ